MYSRYQDVPSILLLSAFPEFKEKFSSTYARGGASAIALSQHPADFGERRGCDNRAGYVATVANLDVAVAERGCTEGKARDGPIGGRPPWGRDVAMVASENPLRPSASSLASFGRVGRAFYTRRAPCRAMSTIIAWP